MDGSFLKGFPLGYLFVLGLNKDHVSIYSNEFGAVVTGSGVEASINFLVHKSQVKTCFLSLMVNIVSWSEFKQNELEEPKL